MLTKTRSVLHRTNIVDGRVYFALEDNPQFALASLPEYLWVDMGSPETVTVAIVPNDTLN